jgi:hypothetical protein
MMVAVTPARRAALPTLNSQQVSMEATTASAYAQRCCEKSPCTTATAVTDAQNPSRKPSGDKRAVHFKGWSDWAKIHRLHDCRGVEKRPRGGESNGAGSRPHPLSWAYDRRAAYEWMDDEKEECDQ